jgi:hypothetical protein
MENGRLALNQRESIHFGDFWHMKMILHIWALQRPFSKLKKRSPTNLYMLYLMVQSVALVCVGKETRKGHSNGIFSIVIGNPLSIRNHFSIQILNFDFIVSKFESIFLI